MAHHNVYMMKVVEVRELENYARAAKDANWSATIEEEMHALAENETLDYWSVGYRIGESESDKYESVGVDNVWMYDRVGVK